jgi:hypothetical protein
MMVGVGSYKVVLYYVSIVGTCPCVRYLSCSQYHLLSSDMFGKYLASFPLLDGLELFALGEHGFLRVISYLLRVN